MKLKTNRNSVACSRMISRTPKTVVAQPGIASVVVSRTSRVTTSASTSSPIISQRGNQEPDADDVAVNRNGAQPVDDQADEVHLRPAIEANGACGRDRLKRLPAR